jgi:ABC-type polysaccharide/polyol phosphate export permease
MLLISVVTAVIILVTGIAYFRRMERAFADVI